MKLVVSIVQCDDAGKLVSTLTKAGFRATTISTTGGFLRQGNATILVGTEEQKVDRVLDLIRESCCTRQQFVNPLQPIVESGEMHVSAPVEVQVGGATVFVLDIVRFEQL